MTHLQNDLTRGNIQSQLIRFIIPMLGASFLQAMYSVVDMIIMGHFVGASGMSSIGIASQVSFTILGLVMGLSVGGGVLIAQYYGANRHEDVQETIGTILSLYVIVALVLAAVAPFVVVPALRLLKTPVEAFPGAMAYLTINMCGSIFIFGYLAISTILRGMGDSERPLIFIAVGTISNILLDLLFVGRFRMGAAGAAWATVIAQGLSLIISVIYLIRKGFLFDFKPSSFRIHSGKLKLLIKIGLPSSIQGVFLGFSFLYIMTLFNGLGVVASAVSGIAGRINQFAMLPHMAITTAISPMVGQNIGAGFYDRAKSTMYMGIKLLLPLATFAFVLVMLFPAAALRIFTTDPAVITMGVQYLRCNSWDFLLTAVYFCMNSLITGSGHTAFVMVNDCLCSVLVRIPTSILLAQTFHMGIAGMGLAAPAATLVGLLAALVFIQGGFWRRNAIQHQEHVVLENEI